MKSSEPFLFLSSSQHFHHSNPWSASFRKNALACITVRAILLDVCMYTPLVVCKYSLHCTSSCKMPTHEWYYPTESLWYYQLFCHNSSLGIDKMPVEWIILDLTGDYACFLLFCFILRCLDLKVSQCLIFYLKFWNFPRSSFKLWMYQDMQKNNLLLFHHLGTTLHEAGETLCREMLAFHWTDNS